MEASMIEEGSITSNFSKKVVDIVGVLFDLDLHLELSVGDILPDVVA